MSYALATRINNLERLNEDLYTKAETDNKLYDLVSGAPALLDSLSELAASINNSPNFFQGVNDLLATKQNLLWSGNRLLPQYIGNGDVTNSEFDCLNGIDINIKAALESKHPLIDASNRLDPSLIGSGLITLVEFNSLNGCSVNIQNALDTIPSPSHL